MIVIRTNAGINAGLGHVVRMYRLAKALNKIGKEVVFLVNQTNRKLEKYLVGFPLVGLYQLGFNIANFNQMDDAALCLDFLKDKSIDRVILDSYDIGIEWEVQVVSNGYKLVVFDDIQRQHNCDYLVDQRWQGNETYQRYRGLVPERCKTLLGPAFFSIDKQLKNNPESDEFTIIFSLGGGGDLMLFRDLLEELALKNIENIVLMPIIGDYATNKEVFLEMSNKYKNIQPVIGKTELLEFYKKASLFVGALGTMFYESRMFGIPAITFSITENQENRLCDLEDFGHYFHIPLDELKQTKKVAKFIITVAKEYGRFSSVDINPKIILDGDGAIRVARAITNKTAPPYEINQHKGIVEVDYTSKLNHELTVRKVNDQDINNYLLARNLPVNRNNMLVDQEILFVEHYDWWLNNKRDSYVVEKICEAQLYIWHKEIYFEDRSYLIGGWFSAAQDTGFDIAFSALEWQLNYTNEYFPDSVWVAIIKKDNKYVNLLNSYLGFKSVNSDSVEFRAIENYFGKLSSEYNYVKK